MIPFHVYITYFNRVYTVEQQTIEVDIHQEVGPDSEIPKVELGKGDYLSRMVLIKSDN
jgi:hypothetical protein